MNDLVVIEEINPAVIFMEVSEIDALLKNIEAQAMSHVPVLETATGRKEIASIANKVARSKTILDGMGKDLVADWKNKAKKVDEVRKHTRDFLDDLKTRVRQPLTDWEAAEAERIEAERLAAEYNAAWDEALAENDLVDRQRAIEAKEAELRRQEEEKAAAEAKAKAEQEEKERKAKEETERKEREARIAKEAAERAEKEAARKIKEAEEAAKKAERDRIAAEERAKIEKEAAIKAEQEKAKREAEEKERARLEREAAEKAKSEKAAANKKHRAKIEAEAMASLVENGLEKEVAAQVVVMLVTGKIKNVTINY